MLKEEKFYKRKREEKILQGMSKEVANKKRKIFIEEKVQKEILVKRKIYLKYSIRKNPVMIPEIIIKEILKEIQKENTTRSLNSNDMVKINREKFLKNIQEKILSYSRNNK